MLRCLIVDDEPLARKGLADYVDQIDFLELAGVAEDPIEALDHLEKQPVDLLLLDIHMPRLNGLDLLRSLRRPPLVIITTAYPDYALEGFQLEVLDYLVKPITFPRFFKAVLRARKYAGLQDAAPGPAPALPAPGPDHFFVRSDGRVERISYDELLYAESMQNYVLLHTRQGRITALMSMKQLLEELPPDRFLRVHKSFSVHLKHVTSVDQASLWIGDREIPVSRARREEVLRAVVGDRLIN